MRASRKFSSARGKQCLPLPAPCKQTHRAEAGGEERERYWERSGGADDTSPIVITWYAW